MQYLLVKQANSKYKLVKRPKLESKKDEQTVLKALEDETKYGWNQTK